MIQKIRRKLVWGYTLAIVTILILSSLASLLALNYFIKRAMQNSLVMEIESEIAESKEPLRKWLQNPDLEPDIIYLSSHELAFTVIECWISPTGELVMAESPRDMFEMLMKLIHEWGYPNMALGEIEFFDESGKEWFFIVMADDVYDDDGTHLGKVIVGNNMTPLMLISRQYLISALIIAIIISITSFLLGNYFAAKAVKPIEIAMQKQRDFVAHASHELRTPLSVMLASIDMLSPYDKDGEKVTDIRDEIINMRNLVNSLLTLARSDNDKNELFCTDFNLCDMAHGVVRGLQHVAASKNIKIVCRFEAEPVIRADETKLRQLLNILFDNAIKYSGDNMVVMLYITQKHTNAIISIKDYGSGIAPKDLPHIFERFYRADKARSRTGSADGFGLGLSIAQLIVKSHEGDIKVESALDQGSIFTVTLPLKRLP